jgi:hypothetical protein
LRRNPVGILQHAVVPDEIAPVLACHYGFTAEELDFILNYDTRLRQGFGGQVKYRFGRSTGEEED